ncbi:MAG: 2Fe-2S iron-sulfur cluster-binding protein [Dehalococcoidia bacterium]|nr:2Fe-2S iron-sulfur cluster-binding protein [Dehalococcoidia bacterium]
MAEEKQSTKMAEKGKLSRRDFLKDAGLIVGGATIGSIALVNACGTTTTETVGVTNTVTNTTTVGNVTNTATTTVTVTPPVTTTDPRAAFNVNGKEYKVDIQPYWSLSHVLRECLGLTALKIGCDRGECGHCTVLVNGKAIYSCLMLANDAIAPAKIETSESLSADKINLEPIAKAYLDNMAYQCGFCTSGFMMATKALLADNPSPTMLEVQEGLSGHMCVCSAIKRVCETVYKLGGGS